MITKDEKEILKKVLGYSYSKQVLEVLKEFNVLNSKDQEFSDRFISHVFNGRYSNQGIEMAIFELYERKLKIQKELSKKRKKIAAKKPEATTSGYI